MCTCGILFDGYEMEEEKGHTKLYSLLFSLEYISIVIETRSSIRKVITLRLTPA